jgi:hypothetical protein
VNAAVTRSQSAQLIPFPKAKKRGAKVRTGPVAAVVNFPTQTVGAQLHKRWLWLRDAAGDWNSDRLDGDPSIEKFPQGWSMETVYAFTQAALGRLTSGDQVGDADPIARREIKEWEAKVLERTRLKDWLRGQGVDPSQGPEAALLSVFGRFSGSAHGPPGAA